jgi:uncharacterized protein (DUF952 family)
MMQPQTAYKVLTADEMAALERDGVFKGSLVDLEDGYIHLSTADQLTATVDKHFDGQTGLHVLAVDLAACGEAVKWEPARGSALFPHLYAPLALETVIAYGPLERYEDGRLKPPVTG